MTIHAERLSALRSELSARNLDGFVVPLTDEHLSEYVGEYARRLHWLTGFAGSAGTAVVLADEAAIFTDGRYTIQVREQVDGTLWSHQDVPATSPARWLGEHARAGARIGYDPWLHTRRFVEDARAALAGRGAELVPVEANPVDAVWTDRPQRPEAALEVHGLKYAGRSSAEKRQEMADALTDADAEAAVVASLDGVAWTFNVRGRDVAHTPVGLAFSLLHADGTADLFVEPAKVTPEVAQHLGNGVRLHPYGEFAAHLGTLAGKTVLVDPERATAAVWEALERGGASPKPGREPAVLPKAIKNPVEIAGQRSAQALDGAAVSRFLHWLEGETAEIAAGRGGLDELGAAARLQAFREETGALVDDSFDTISGAGPNGAVPHYRVTPDTNRPIEAGTLFLIDSGGQYRDGTTDVTRTIAVGPPTAEMRDRFTRVLKGHIALATAVFPDGTRGSQLDAFARQHLWAAGLDYQHGTGHGVGSFLSVHEGPQRIAKATGGQAGTEEPLRAGMILSNEPGYYKAGHWGIRIENLILVEPREVAGAEDGMLGFETLTFAPIDRGLIELGLLTADERAWMDAYHARVMEVVGPGLEGEARSWLERACAPL